MAFSLELSPYPEPGGPLSFARVPWDSDALGIEVYELRCEGDAADVARELPRLLALLAARGRHLAVARIPVRATALASVLAAERFYPVETGFELSLSLARPLPGGPRAPESLRLRDATREDLPALEEMARHAFRTDRFHLDPSVSDAKADARYAGWIARALADGDPVFAYEDVRRQGVIGFFHVRAAGDDSGEVDLSLAAIAADYERSGIGVFMYRAVLEECRSRGFRVAETRITAENLGVLNLFASLGFSFRNPRFCFHRPG